jgi:hypothetical protein
MRKKLGQFDVEKDEWSCQKKPYVNTRTPDSLDEELEEFRVAQSTGDDGDVPFERLPEDLCEPQAIFARPSHHLSKMMPIIAWFERHKKAATTKQAGKSKTRR